MPNTSQPPAIHRKNRLIYFLMFFLVKWMITLAILNFYMGSKLEAMEQSFSNIMSTMSGRSPDSAKEDYLANEKLIADAVASKDLVPKSGTSNNRVQIMNTTEQFAEGEKITPNLSDGTLQGKERLWNILTTRNITEIDAKYWSSVPVWDDILQQIQNPSSRKNESQGPIIHGLETCQAFQQLTSSNPSNRRIAPAGLFNTGTNYLSVLLDYNCQNPHRVDKFHGNAKRGHGNEWEVPWGKHNPPDFRGRYSKDPKVQYTVDEVLPVVLVRNPFGWQKSMCRSPYAAHWDNQFDKKSPCPQLKKENGDWNNVDVDFGTGKTHHQSLADLWNDWYGQYFYKNYTNGNKDETAPFPRLMIRFEDIIFFPYEVTEQVCKCAGGVLGHRQDDKDVVNGTFHYVVKSAKAGFGHGPVGQRRNGIIDSWVKYGSDPRKDYEKDDVPLIEGVLDPVMMETFGYKK